MNFTDFFDRVVVISRADRPHRRARCEAHLEALGLGGGVAWFPAILGRLETAPSGWNAGAGAWGCLQSHLEVLQEVQASGIPSVLVLEDDVVFSRHIHDALPRFMAALPERWHQLYLGGQHVAVPDRTENPLVNRVRNVNRTHAYAVRGEAAQLIRRQLRALAKYERGSSCHVDAQMGLAHERRQWETFAPSWWLAGQGACVSDVCEGKSLPERWWHFPRYAPRLPFVLVRDRSLLPAAVQDCLLFDDAPFLSRTHRSALAASLRSDASLCRWLLRHAEQALVFARLPAWEAGCDRLRRLWPAGMVEAGAADLLELTEYPFNQLFPHPFGQAN